MRFDDSTPPQSAIIDLSPPARPGAGQIVVSGLTKRFRKTNVVDNLSFTVEPGRVTGFLGPNGAGKTTTLRMLLNLVTPSAGSATISGFRYTDLPAPTRHVGAVLEAGSAHGSRSGLDHLRIICAAAGLPDERADEVLELCGLTVAANRKFKGYSLGMRQRIGIAAAMLGDPRVLILDEPANGLDPEGIRWMRGLLQSLADDGRTILVSSHQLAEIEQLADDVVIIADGRLVRQGTIAEVVSGAHTRALVSVRTPSPDLLTTTIVGRGGTVTAAADGTLLVAGLTAAEIGAAAFAAGVELHELAPARADLEGAFLELTHGMAAIR
jgi:ABC-2 type transport system ATP-binding protein